MKSFKSTYNKIFVSLVLTIVSLLIAVLAVGCSSSQINKTIVYQSDFGLKDGAVSAMKGVALQVDKDLNLYDLTHDIPAFSIWDAAIRLQQTVEYWPEFTVFVSVVDPGVGSDRLPVVAKTRDNKYIVTPDNGTLTLIKDAIVEVRVIDKSMYREGKSGDSYTFDGRDLFSYTAAKLASGQISYEKIGNTLDGDIVALDFQKPSVENGVVKGCVAILDVAYGNLWSNIPKDICDSANIEYNKNYSVKIYENNVLKYSGQMPLCKTFSDVDKDQNLLYFNSLGCLSVAVNEGDFASQYNISYGNEWTLEISKI